MHVVVVSFLFLGLDLAGSIHLLQSHLGMLLQLRVVDEAALDRLDDTLRLAVDKHPLH